MRSPARQWVRTAARATALLAAAALSVAAFTVPAGSISAHNGHGSLTVAPKPRPTASGDAKTGCIYSDNSVSEMERIGAAIGRPFECASVYNYSSSTWAQWELPWFIDGPPTDAQWAKWVKQDPGVRRMIIAQALIPTTGVPADWRKLGAAGAYDAHIRTLARNLIHAGLGHSIIDLAPEANGNWNIDNVGKTNAQYAQWRAYWARFARVMRSVPGAHFSFNWVLNSAYRDIPLAKIYPGNSAVNIVGVDVYDQAGIALPPAPSTARWTAIAHQPDGVATIAAFAKKHHKPLSIPEWGLVSHSSGGGGDDPAFVSAIADVMRVDNVAFQCLFDHAVDGVLPIQGEPASFGVYEQDFGAASEVAPLTARAS